MNWEIYNPYGGTVATYKWEVHDGKIIEIITRYAQRQKIGKPNN